MSDVKRYECSGQGGMGHWTMPPGEYILASDYDTLLAVVKAAEFWRAHVSDGYHGPPQDAFDDAVDVYNASKESSHADTE